jgi:hypothetical protein
MFGTTPEPQAGGTLLVGYPQLLIQYIRSYPTYLEAVSSIHNLRTRDAVSAKFPIFIIIISPHLFSK